MFASENNLLALAVADVVDVRRVHSEEGMCEHSDWQGTTRWLSEKQLETVVEEESVAEV